MLNSPFGEANTPVLPPDAKLTSAFKNIDLGLCVSQPPRFPKKHFGRESILKSAIGLVDPGPIYDGVVLHQGPGVLAGNHSDKMHPFIHNKVRQLSKVIWLPRGAAQHNSHWSENGYSAIGSDGHCRMLSPCI